jgi:hypothetical protein
MLVWLAGLASGVWWFWPLLTRPTLSTDFLGAVIYLLLGIVTWLLALTWGWARYLRRR